jgi:TRAP-type C4-dicarboxylate transport system permease small subunit
MGARRLEQHIVRGLRLVVGALMVSAVVINFANVIARYLFFRPFVWAEETMQFLHLWAVMLGAAVITGAGEHLRMDALYHFSPPPVRRALDLLGDMVSLAVSLFVIMQAVDMVRMLSGTGQRSVIAGVPMNLMYLSIPIGFGCGALFLARSCLRLGQRDASAMGGPHVA